MTKDLIQAFTMRIANANRTEMIVILYDMGLEYISEAKECLRNNEVEGFRAALQKLRGVVRELSESVNVSVDPGLSLIKLYVFCNAEITKAYIYCDDKPLDGIIYIFEKFNGAYRELSKLDTSGPVMDHVETVYTGLTYNRNSYGESISAAEMNRGYFA